jgi:hypothetical protein
MPASAITRKQAARKALTALGSSTGSNPVIVFGLRKSLRAGTRVTQTGSNRVATVGHQRAFFFYEDSGPFQLYPHQGRVALVGARSGNVRVSKRIAWAPLVNGKRPAFLSSSQGYRSARYRVFYRGSSRLAAPAAGTVFANGPLAPTMLSANGNSKPKAEKQDALVKENRPKNITLTASDDDGDTLTYAITQQPDHGTLSGALPYVTYTPDPNYLGKDKFAFKAYDDVSQSNTAHVSIDVVPLGQPPAVTTSSGCTAYVKHSPAVAVDSLLTVSDPDDATLDSARVRISANFEYGDDLTFTDQNGISGSYDDTTGVLTLTGTASKAQYQAALRSVRYRNLASGSPSATKDVEFTVNDAGSDSAPATKQICITGGTGGGNDKPIGQTSEAGLSYTENDGPVPVDGGFVVGDPDSANLSGATIKFIPVVSQPVDENGDPVGPPVTTNTFAPAEDSLAFVDQNGISGSYNASTGVLTLSGTASLANYETAIRSVTYQNSSENPSDATRRVRFQVTDSGGASSTPSTRDIFVTPVNDAPVVTPTEGSTSYTEGDPLTAVDSGLTVGDVDNTSLQGGQVRISSGFQSADELVFVDQNGISGSYNTGTGVLTLTGTASVANYQTALRSIKYRHTGDNPDASKTVEFVVNDGQLDANPATKDIAVTPVNDKPVLSGTTGALSYTENAPPVVVDPGIGATDPDSATFAGATVQISSNLSVSEDRLAVADQNGITGSYDEGTGTLTLSGTASVADYETALRSVTYENTSDNPSTATRTVTFRADDGGTSDNLSDPITRDIDVTPVNDAPVVTTSDGPTGYAAGDIVGPYVDAALTVSDADDTNIESAQVKIASGYQSGDDLVYVDQSGISGVYNAGTGVLDLTGSAPVADYEAALRSVRYRYTGESSPGPKAVEFTVNDGDLGSAAATKNIVVNAQPVLTTTGTALSYTAGDGAVAVDPGITATDADSATLQGATVQVTSGFSSGEDALAFADQAGITGFYDEEIGTLTLTGTASVADYETALRSVTYRNSSASPSTDTRTVTFRVDDGAAANNLSEPATRDITVAPAN